MNCPANVEVISLNGTSFPFVKIFNFASTKEFVSSPEKKEIIAASAMTGLDLNTRLNDWSYSANESFGGKML